MRQISFHARSAFHEARSVSFHDCKETEYWLKLFVKTGIINEDIYQKLSNNGGKIRRILIASINTTKDNS
ncbi:MAG: four helix bundle protein [Clostridia bacterium]|nr:four helix bundle protein [Clostridia bacterium]